MKQKPAYYMSDEAISRELKRLEAQWDRLRADDEGHGGSPGEWMIERMDELCHERDRRAAGGARQTEMPMRSR